MLSILFSNTLTVPKISWFSTTPSLQQNTLEIPKCFKVHGHRGFGVEKPENTLDAFSESVRQGLDYIETDVWLTKDQIPVIIHADNELGMCEVWDPMAEQKKNIFITKTNFEDLKKMVYIKSGSTVPTLDEVIKLVKDSDTKINLEIKDWNPKVISLS